MRVAADLVLTGARRCRFIYYGEEIG